MFTRHLANFIIRKPLDLSGSSRDLSKASGSGEGGLPLDFHLQPLDGLVTIGYVKATWLILPVVIRSSQRLSHACLSITLLL